MSYASIDGLEILAQQAHVDDSLSIQRLSRVPNDNDSGDCQNCGDAIPVARLAAVPNARYCVACQSKHEGRGPKFVARNPYMP